MTGCLHLQQELTLKDDRTGTFRVALAMPLATYQAWMADPASPLAKALAPHIDPERGAAGFPETDGFRLRAYRVFDRDGAKLIQVEGAITDLPRALASGKLGDWQWQMADGGARRLRLRLPAPPDTAGNAEARRALRELVAGAKVQIAITVPREVVAAPGARIAGTTATWLLASVPEGEPLWPAELILTYR
jgi:hypothetical protein